MFGQFQPFDLSSDSLEGAFGPHPGLVSMLWLIPTSDKSCAVQALGPPLKYQLFGSPLPQLILSTQYLSSILKMSETPCGTMSIHNRFINSSEVATYLSVGAGVTFSSWLSVAGDVTFSSSLSVSNSVTLSSRLSVASNVTMSSSLSVSDDVTLSSRLSAASDVTVSSSLSVSNRVVMSSTLSVANHVQLSSHLSVAGSADITGRVYQATHMLVPPGSVVAYISTSAPGGWLLCDGSNVSRTTYATLFSVIGTTFGVGDGSTTFTLPDMRGRVPVGSGSGAGAARLRAGAGARSRPTRQRRFRRPGRRTPAQPRPAPAAPS